MVAAAQAVHWFDLDAFYTEAGRVLKPDGIIAVWSYGWLRLSPAVDAVLHGQLRRLLEEYWPPERRLVDDGYCSLPFPFHEVAAPGFTMTARWTLPELLGYLGTWSSVGRFRDATGRDPLKSVGRDLADAWGAGDPRREVTWPLALRVGRNRPHPASKDAGPAHPSRASG